jgi:hypothetical protein
MDRYEHEDTEANPPALASTRGARIVLKLTVVFAIVLLAFLGWLGWLVLTA